MNWNYKYGWLQLLWQTIRILYKKNCCHHSGKTKTKHNKKSRDLFFTEKVKMLQFLKKLSLTKNIIKIILILLKYFLFHKNNPMFKNLKKKPKIEQGQHFWNTDVTDL